MKNRIHNNRCIDCKILIDDRAKRCRNCLIKWQSIPENASNFQNQKIEMNCSFCHKKIGKYLNQINKNKGHVFCNFKCMGLYRRQQYIGNNNPAWIDGSSYQDYPSQFTEVLREQIRERDNHECQNCGITEEEHLIIYGRMIEVHHIDYNKENCNKDNLITTCKQCNLRANTNRPYWQEFYTNKIKVLIK
jgi:hypothetical protein